MKLPKLQKMSSKVKLGVNIDHVATLRQARRGEIPDPVHAALLAERAGADGITVHLREDRRHIQDEDVRSLRKKIKTKLNLEMACADSIVHFACKVKPDNVCLVPEKREELTTEGGLNVWSQKEKIRKVVSKLKRAGIVVSIFVYPEPRQIIASKEVGAECVELHTGSYAEAKNKLHQDSEFRKLVKVGRLAKKLGLILNAGHGLDYKNVSRIAKIDGMHELNIGFSIMARALFVGLGKAVMEMKFIINRH